MKKIFTIILAIIMCMAMTFTVYANSDKYVFDEAENRMHTIKAVIAATMGAKFE